MLVWMVAALIGAGTPLACVLATPRASNMGMQVKCAKQLLALGQAMMLYSNEQGDGSFPSSFGRLWSTQDFDPKFLVCPSSDDTPAAGKSRDEVEANLLNGGHASYVYTGEGLNWHSGTTHVLAYESAGHHKRGSHVLYGDGHVEFVAPERAAKIAAEIGAGHNPPRPERIK